MSQPTPTPPPGYAYARPLFANWDLLEKYPQWLLLIYANFVALLPLGGGVLLLWLPYQVYRFNSSPLALWPTLTLPLGWKIVLGVLILGGSMLLHEWLHGLTLQLFGHKPHYAFLKLYLVATIQKGSFLTRRQYLVMTLTPVISMTLVGGVLLLFLPPAIALLLLIALLVNTAASIGDIIVAWRVFQSPPDAMFSDDHGIQLFLPASQTNPNAL
ncbi:DUF3267 domain-containing protein [Candidatus Leptofilum sp.]|uniref:DUF3267 domain-containing protein n=1 Tax=Candidatus Leptofilum sp. TaxID=3241576 RepID=UPI003B5A083B